jgi:glyoxylase-like metal-dependent hydrolase (beta-lactamase superfamily II)
MFIKQFFTGGDRNLAYIAADESTHSAVIIDPSFTPEKIFEFAVEKSFKIDYVLITHNHGDHTNGNDVIANLTGLRPLFYGDMEPRSGAAISDGATIPLGELTIEIMHTPGHTPDSICVYVGDAVFTGDTLFVGKVGGTDFDHGARVQYESLHDRLMQLPDTTRVFPGHDVGVRPESTIMDEKRTNPFLLQPDIQSFISLKKNWLEYKRQHNIA